MISAGAGGDDGEDTGSSFSATWGYPAGKKDEMVGILSDRLGVEIDGG